jgi:hypothetical protein
MSPINLSGASWVPERTFGGLGCRGPLGGEDGDLVGDERGEGEVMEIEGGRGRQAMNVSLSGSLRQVRCIAYSSSNERGSDAVAACISWIFVSGWGLEHDEMVVEEILHLSSRCGKWARDGVRRGRGGF